MQPLFLLDEIYYSFPEMYVHLSPKCPLKECLTIPFTYGFWRTVNPNWLV